MSAMCESCGRSVDDHDRDIRFTLPDPVLAASPPADHIWMSHYDAATSVMMQVRDLGAFARVLLPVSLTGGYSVTFGVWLAVHRDDLKRAYGLWRSPEYPSLELDGLLANAVPPWGLFGSPVRAVVRDPQHTPYCDSTTNADLAAVLDEEWAHDVVLDALPNA